MNKTTKNSMKLINLKALHTIMEESWEKDHKFFTILDHTGQCEIFFKYQGNILNVLEDHFNDSEKIGKLWLRTLKHPRVLTFNFEDIDYESPFHKEWFPTGAIDSANYNDWRYFEPYRMKFPEFDDILIPNKEYYLVFLFRKNNIPSEFFDKTIVLEVVKDDEYAKIIEEQKNKKEEIKEEVKETKSKAGLSNVTKTQNKFTPTILSKKTNSNDIKQGGSKPIISMEAKTQQKPNINEKTGPILKKGSVNLNIDSSSNKSTTTTSITAKTNVNAPKK